MSMQILSQRFSHLTKIASTNFSSVYRAIDSVGKHSVALKVATGAVGAPGAALKREFNFLSSCTHPNIVEAFDFGTDETDRPFYTMKWILGATLAEAAPRAQIIASHAIPELCSALADIHSTGFIYGDLNPSNVIVTRKNGGFDSTLIDFGLVSRIGASYPGELRGTPDYMAPEIHRGDPLTPATDVYSFGVLLRHLLEDPEGAQKLDLSTSVDLGPLLDLVQQCLYYYPDSRPQDFRQIEELWWRTIARSKSKPGYPAPPTRKSQKLFGREADMQRLRSHCEDLLDRGGGIIIIDGVGGVGKTALIRAHCQLVQMQGSATLRIICDDVAQKVDIILEAIDTWIAGSQCRGEPEKQGLLIYLQTGGQFETDSRPVRCLIEKIRGRRIVCIVECGQAPAPGQSEGVCSLTLGPLTASHFEEFLNAAFDSDPLVPVLSDFLYEASGGIPGLMEAKRLEYAEHLRLRGKADGFSWRKPPRAFYELILGEVRGFTTTEKHVLQIVAQLRRPCTLDEIIGLSAMPPQDVAEGMASFVRRQYITAQKTIRGQVYRIATLWLDAVFQSCVRRVSDDEGSTEAVLSGEDHTRRWLRQPLAAPRSVAEAEAWTHDYRDIRHLREAVIACRGISRRRRPWDGVSAATRRAMLNGVTKHYERVGDIARARMWVLRLTKLDDLYRSSSVSPSFEIIHETVQALNRLCTPRQLGAWITHSLHAYPDIDPAIRALLISEMGVVEYYAQAPEKALARFFEAEAICATLTGHHGPRARNLNRIGSLYMARRQHVQALKYYQLAEKEARKETDREIKASIKINIGIALITQGLAGKAQPFLQSGRNYAKQAHHFKLLSMVNRNMTLCQADLAPAPEAVRSAEEALAMAAKVGDKTFRALGLSNLGWVYLRAGNVREAYTNILSAIAAAKETGNLNVLALAYLNLARLSHLQGRQEESIRHAVESCRAARRQKSPQGCAEALREIAVYLLALGRVERAERILRRAMRIGGDQPNLRERFFNDIVAAEIDSQTGRLDTARERLAGWESSQYGELLPGWVCALHRVRGLLESAAGNSRSACTYLREAACQARTYERYDLLIPVYEDLVDCYTRLANTRVGVPYAVELSRLYQKVGRMDQNSKLEAAIQSLMQHPYDADAANMVFQLSESLARFSDKRQLLDHLLNLAVNYFGADRGALISKHPVSGHWFVEAQQGLETDLDRTDAVEISKSVIRKVSETSQCLQIDNAVDDPNTKKRKSIILNNIQSVLCVPVLIGSSAWGVIYLDNRSVPGAFAHTDIRILQALANFMALAIEQTDEMERLRLSESTTRTSENPDLPFIAVSRKMRSLLSIVDKIADSEVSVVILGENGAGKDMLAKYIHQKSGRREEPFITMNCAGIVETLAESELFGIENNIASGVKFREGKFKLADRGTLFLNEIGDLPLEIQPKLLHALEEGMIERVGGSPMPVDVRFIAATNKNLDEMVRAQEFRQDLFYRINSVSVTVPPLAERIDDIPALAKSFLDYFCRKYGRRALELTEKNFEEFAMYHWPGNVRELKGLIERGVLLGDGKAFPLGLTRSASPKAAQVKNGRRKLDVLLEQTERECIVEALGGTGWNQSKAANWLGLSESTLRSKIQRLGIEKPRKL